MKLIPTELKKEAAETLLETILTSRIPKLNVSDGMGGIVEHDYEDWQEDFLEDSEGNYTLPLYYVQKFTADGDKYVPVAQEILFTRQEILDKALDIAKIEYPEMFNEIINVNEYK